MKIKLRNIKKWKKIDPDELLKAYEARTPKAEPTFKDEAAWVDDMNRLAGKQERQSHIRTKESADPDKLKFLAAYGEYHPRTYIDLSREEIGRIATKIETDVATKKLAKVRDTFKKVILANKTKYLTKPAKPEIGATDWVSDSPVLTKAILNIRKSTQPKLVLTPAGKAKDIKRISAEASAIKIGRQRAETFKTEAAKSGYSVERIGDLEKQFVKRTRKGMVKAPVTSETAIELGFPGKGTGYDPFGVGTANEILIEFGKQAKGSPKIRHPFQPKDYAYGEYDYKFKADVQKWKSLPIIQGVKGTKIKQKGKKISKEQINIGAIVDPGGKVKFITPMGSEAKGLIGGQASRYLKEEGGGYSRITPYTGRVVSSKEVQKQKTQWYEGQQKRIAKIPKSETRYSITKSGWTKANKRLESEFLKGLQKKKGPFFWE